MIILRHQEPPPGNVEMDVVLRIMPTLRRRQLGATNSLGRKEPVLIAGGGRSRRLDGLFTTHCRNAELSRKLITTIIFIDAFKKS